MQVVLFLQSRDLDSIRDPHLSSVLSFVKYLPMSCWVKDADSRACMCQRNVLPMVPACFAQDVTPQCPILPTTTPKPLPCPGVEVASWPGPWPARCAGPSIVALVVGSHVLSIIQGESLCPGYICSVSSSYSAARAQIWTCVGAIEKLQGRDSLRTPDLPESLLGWLCHSHPVTWPSC